MKKSTILATIISTFILANEPPKSIKEFIPKGYEVLNFTKGNLNLDKFDDAILILKDKNEDVGVKDDDELKRPLLILIGNRDGNYTLKAENNSSVLGKSDGGIYGDPFDGVTIKNGYFSIEYYGGSNWRWLRVVTFKYDKKRDGWFLYQDSEESYHTSNPNKITKDIKGVKDFGIIDFKNYNDTISY